MANKVTASSYTSVDTDAGWPKNRSGAMYAGVPRTMPLWVGAAIPSLASLAMPKSSSTA
jgi:hypothetical protein